MLEYFKQVYAKGKWGKGSGVGSDPRNVPDYIGVLQTFLRDMQIRSVVDVGCGDWQLGACIDWTGGDYLGVDVVPSLVEQISAKHASANVRFVCSDVQTMELPRAELLIMKDVMQHWLPAEISAFLPRLAQFPYSLITNDVEAPELRPKWHERWHPLDLTKPPYCLPGELLLVQYVAAKDPPKATYLFRGEDVGGWNAKRQNGRPSCSS